MSSQNAREVMPNYDADINGAPPPQNGVGNSASGNDDFGAANFKGDANQISLDGNKTTNFNPQSSSRTVPDPYAPGGILADSSKGAINSGKGTMNDRKLTEHRFFSLHNFSRMLIFGFVILFGFFWVYYILKHTAFTKNHSSPSSVTPTPRANIPVGHNSQALSPHISAAQEVILRLPKDEPVLRVQIESPELKAAMQNYVHNEKIDRHENNRKGRNAADANHEGRSDAQPPIIIVNEASPSHPVTTPNKPEFWEPSYAGGPLPSSLHGSRVD